MEQLKEIVLTPDVKRDPNEDTNPHTGDRVVPEGRPARHVSGVQFAGLGIIGTQDFRPSRHEDTFDFIVYKVFRP